MNLRTYIRRIIKEEITKTEADAIKALEDYNFTDALKIINDLGDEHNTSYPFKRHENLFFNIYDDLKDAIDKREEFDVEKFIKRLKNV